MKIKGFEINFYFALYDFWVGLYFTTKCGRRRIYFCPLPCCVIKITFPHKEKWGKI